MGVGGAGGWCELGEGGCYAGFGAEVEIVVDGFNESGLGFLKSIAVEADDVRDIGDMADEANSNLAVVNI